MRPIILLNLAVLVLVKSAQSLRYNFGDGSYYVGSVDNQGRPSGRGQYHNSSGDLGNFQSYTTTLLYATTEIAAGYSWLIMYTITGHNGTTFRSKSRHYHIFFQT